MMKLNDTQTELLGTAKEKGFLTIDDFKMQYSSLITIKSNIERFILLKILGEKDVDGKYKYLGELK